MDGLELVAIGKSYGPVQALRGVHLSAEAGEVVGICGERGAGKSTLVKILGGIHPHGTFDGEIRIDGAAVQLKDPDAARRAGIAVVHEQSALVARLSVAHNLMLGCEPRRFGLVDDARLEAEARAQLERHGVAGEIDLGARVGELEPAMQQIVEIIRALGRDARVLVIDERPATRAQRDRLFRWLRRLEERGITCIHVAQRIDDLVGRCDQINVLCDGAATKVIGGARVAGEGRYLIGDEIGTGGMATVHLGKIRGPYGFTSTVAIKRLHPPLARDPDIVAMFLDEARLASHVRHPNVVPVLDMFAEDGELHLVMEYVEGEAVARLGTPPPAVAVAIVAGVLHGLHAAHEARDEHGAPLGLVHRDVSPHNVLVGADGVARVIDFGIAKAACRVHAARTGLKGKLAYMAPEQIRRGPVDRRTDVYGAAVLLWELLVGEPLFDGDTRDDVPPPSSLADTPRALDPVVLRALERDPQRRFASAHEMARALAAAQPPADVDAVARWVEDRAGAALAERREKERSLTRRRAGRGPRSAAAASAG